ncbi:MAG: membrane protease YdiL (CAAX protease family) [Planctomycetota bacterium]|jgi:membrane protease YdiL (CAAX protease family)
MSWQDTAEQALDAMSTGQVMSGMLMGAVGVGISLYLVRERILPAWRGLEEPSPALPWQRLHVVLLFLIYLLAGEAVGLSLRLIYGDVAWTELGVMPSLVASLLVNALLAVGIWTLGLSFGGSAAVYGLQRPPNRSHVVRGVLMYVACVPAIYGASSLWMSLLHLSGAEVLPQVVSELVKEAAGYERWAVFLMAAVLVPITEEFIFRGFLQTWLVKSQGAFQGILMASVLFALLHGTTAFGPLLAISLAAGWARHATGSLWPAIVVHICNNAVAAILLFREAGSLGS